MQQNFFSVDEQIILFNFFWCENQVLNYFHRPVITWNCSLMVPKKKISNQKKIVNYLNLQELSWKDWRTEEIKEKRKEKEKKKKIFTHFSYWRSQR